MKTVALGLLVALTVACTPTSSSTEVPLQYRPTPTDRYSLRGDGLTKGFRVVHLDEQLAASTVFAGRTLTFQVLDADSHAPRLALDGQTQGVRFEKQRKGYVQAFLRLETFDGEVERYLAIAVYHHDTPWVVMMPLGSRFGSLTRPGRDELPLQLHDSDANGDYSDEALLIDVDGNGRLARCESVSVGETVRIGSLVLEHAGADRAGRRLDLRLDASEPAVPARDMRAELETAPLPGNLLPRLQGQLVDGSPFDTAEMLGRPLFLMFAGWSATTWQADDLRAALDLAGDADITVLALQREPEPGSANAPSWTWGHQERAHTDALWVTGFPTIFLVDREGVILTRRFDMRDETRRENLRLLTKALTGPTERD